MQLIELLVVIAIMVILIGLAIPAVFYFEKHSKLNSAISELVNNVKTAQGKSLSSEGSSAWGVYFDTSVQPHQYIIFRGASYALRSPAFDRVYRLKPGLSFSKVDLAGSSQEIVFEKITGFVSAFGEVVLGITSEPSFSKSIFITSTGLIQQIAPLVPSDTDRIKDSRHTHFTYSRSILLTESIVLTFENNQQEIIPIASNIQAGQIFWEGDIDVQGETQHLKIHTHSFNNPDTLFCVHRQRTQNSKGVKIDIDGDPNYPGSSPLLINYSTEGLTTQGNSFFVTGPLWQ